jgi:Spx/MgsR family transcriptional regulator
MKIYGLPNCDTTRAAIKWAKVHRLDVDFFDLKNGIPGSVLEDFLQLLPFEKLLNKKSTTWRSLTPSEQEQASEKNGAAMLIQQYPTLLKRPVIAWPDQSVTAGYNEQLFASKITK